LTELIVDNFETMDGDIEGPISLKQRARIVASHDRMVATGRLTKEEADRLRGADEPGEFDSDIRGIRIRHAGAKLAGAIEDGSLSQEDRRDPQPIAERGAFRRDPNTSPLTASQRSRPLTADAPRPTGRRSRRRQPKSRYSTLTSTANLVEERATLTPQTP
jgi:hypothetical protein